MTQPILALILWTLIMLVWLYAKRIPAMQSAKIRPDDYKIKNSGSDKLPESARAIADNYNHLFEAPTIFYALAILIQISGKSDFFFEAMAWGYVALRVCHSIIQATMGKVIIRFSLFISSMILLAIMALRFAIMSF